MASKKRRIRQYQRSTGKRSRKHGFRVRMRSATGVSLISRRRRKGRRNLSAQKLGK